MPENIPKDKAGQTVQLVIFSVGKEEFAVLISEIREIIRVGPITPVPDAPAFIKGLINVRGEIVATIDFKYRFALQTRLTKADGVAPKHIIVTKQGNTLFGLIVDEVTEVLRILETEIKKAPDLVSHLHQQYVTGVVAMENRLIIMIDLARVLSEQDLERLMEVGHEIKEGMPEPEMETNPKADVCEQEARS